MTSGERVKAAAAECGFDLCGIALFTFTGISVPKPPFMGPGGVLSIPLVGPAPPLGVMVSIQAAILAPVPPLGFVVTNAYTLAL